ncbi:MAG UNVERIFIED_CONTAM: response regulator transcription factor [Rickettsiaceae bacterium]
MNKKSKPHILVVDDDTRILKLLSQFLSSHNYLVSTASCAKEAEEYLKEFIIDLMMVDVMMPEVTGIEFAKHIRDSKIHVPIILLTALSEPEDRIAGLEAGADDYITKPFEPKELLLRTENLINLYGRKQDISNKINFGLVVYDMQSKILYNNDSNQNVINMSSRERKLLDLFIENRGKVLSRDTIVNFMGTGTSERSIDVQIVRLRNKIEYDPKHPRYLQTIRNEGYILYI